MDCTLGAIHLTKHIEFSYSIMILLFIDARVVDLVDLVPHKPDAGLTELAIGPHLYVEEHTANLVDETLVAGNSEIRTQMCKLILYFM